MQYLLQRGVFSKYFGSPILKSAALLPQAVFACTVVTTNKKTHKTSEKLFATFRKIIRVDRILPLNESLHSSAEGIFLSICHYLLMNVR